MKKRLMSILLALALLVPAMALPASAASAQLKQQRETEHFVFYCADTDLEALDDLEESFEGCYQRVTTDLGKAPSGKTRVNIYPSLQAFHNAMGRPNDPDWSVGEAKSGAVYMTSPLDPGPQHSYQSIITVAVHEYVHIVIEQFHRSQPSYLNEGLAAYEAGQGDNVKYTVQQDAEKNALPSLSTVASLNAFNNSKYNIYTYGYAYVEFIVERFGFDKVIALLEGKSRSEVLGMSESELNEAWLTFLKTYYRDTPNLNKADKWARDEIDRAVKKGFVPEDLQDNYKDVITREQFCRLAVTYLEYATGKDIDAILEEKNLTVDPDAFEDTDDRYILAAYALEITKGTRAPAEGKPGKFSPDGGFNREMAAAMLARVAQALGKDTGGAPDAGYTDIGDAAGWAVNDINFCYASGMMQGTSETPLKFSPKTAYTIQQSIAAFGRIKK